MNQALLIAIYTPLGGIIVFILNWLRDRRKQDVETDLNAVQGAQVVQGMALGMLDPLSSEISKLQTKVKELEQEVNVLTSEIRKERSLRFIAEEQRDYYRELSMGGG